MELKAPAAPPQQSGQAEGAQRHRDLAKAILSKFLVPLWILTSVGP